MTEHGARKQSAFSRRVGRVSTAFGYACAILMLASMLVLCYAVLLRYMVGASTAWQTELAMYFLLFAAFCGAAYGLRHGDHVRIEIVTMRLAPRVRLMVRIVGTVLALVLVVVIAVKSFGTWWESTEAGRRSGSVWNPPLTIPHLIVPVGMTLLALQFVAVLVDLTQVLRSGAAEESTTDCQDTGPGEAT